MVAEIFGMDGVIVLVVGIVPLAVVIWGVVDAARRPEEVWQRALQNKALWITLQAVGLLFCWIGFILSIVYLAAIRPKLAAVEANGGSGYGTLDYGAGGGQSAPGWYPDPQVPSQLRYWDGQAWTAQSAPQ